MPNHRCIHDTKHQVFHNKTMYAETLVIVLLFSIPVAIHDSIILIAEYKDKTSLSLRLVIAYQTKGVCNYVEVPSSE